MTTRYHSIFEPGVEIIAPPEVGLHQGSLPDIVEYVRDRAEDAVSFDIGQVGQLPRESGAPHGQSFPYIPMWLECVGEEGNPICIFIFKDPEIDKHAAIVFHKGGRQWVITSYFTSNFEPGATCMINDIAAKNHTYTMIASGALTIIMSFLAALACVNVVPVETPAPTKLNKKRAKRGKKPILSHWTLVIKNRNGTVGPGGGGSHASPRLHLRRGHIREYKPGSYTWVQPCVVGTNKDGMVTKDYKLEAPV